MYISYITQDCLVSNLMYREITCTDSTSLFFREILQRVSDVMFVFGFIHVFDAVAVRNYNCIHLTLNTDKLKAFLTRAACLVTGRSRRGSQRSRETVGRCSVQPGGILLNRLPYRSVTDVRSKHGDRRYEKTNKYGEILMMFFFLMIKRHSEKPLNLLLSLM